MSGDKKIIIIASPNGAGKSRQFSSGLNNFENIYRHCVDYWQLINNSGDMPVLIEKGENP